MGNNANVRQTATMNGNCNNPQSDPSYYNKTRPAPSVWAKERKCSLSKTQGNIAEPVERSIAVCVARGYDEDYIILQFQERFLRCANSELVICYIIIKIYRV